MPLEFGLRLGLASDMQYDKRIQDLRYNEEANRRAKNDAEAKAKVFADDFNYTNAMNTHDNPLVKQAAQFQIKRIGSFVNNNPDWQTNVQKRAEYQQLLRELKDNPDLNRGLSTDKEFELMNKYMGDPKNAEITNSPEFETVKRQRNNYLQFGNQYANSADQVDSFGGKKAFVFQSPEAKVSTADALIKYAASAEHDEFGYYGTGGYKKTVSETRKLEAAEHAIADSYWGKYLKKDYDSYVSQLVGNEKTNAKTINEFTRERMDPYYKSVEIDKGFAPHAAKPSSPGSNTDMWSTMHAKAMSEPGRMVELSPKAMQDTFGNDFGQINLNGVKSPLNGKPLNLGLIKADATGLVTVTRSPNGQPMANHKVSVKMPVEQFYTLGSEYKNIIDEGGMGQITPGGPRNAANNWDIHDEYQTKFKKFTDPKGRDFVEFEVGQIYDPNNVNFAANYDNAHGIKAREENPYSGIDTDQNEQVVSDDGKWSWNGKEWVSNK